MPGEQDGPVADVDPCDWNPGPEEQRKERITGRRRWRFGACVALLFLISPLYYGLTSPGSLGMRVLLVALLVAFGTWYVVVVPLAFDRRSWLRWGAIVGQAALGVPLVVAFGDSGGALWIYAGVAAGMLVPLGQAVAASAVLAAVLVGIGLPAHDVQWELALTMVAMTAFVGGFAANIRLNQELRKTRRELAEAAVVAERQRIARDLHDILGHSLTAITVKAGLARKLLDRDAPAAAATEIADVERLSREALADVRATASGYRTVTLSAEIAVAGSVLRAAGIRPDLPHAVDEVPAEDREILGYVVREAVTNVIRHARAGRCSVVLGPRSVEIRDDGVGCADGTADGTAGGAAGGDGLRGLAERVRLAGGTLEAGPLSGGGFRVHAALAAQSAGRQVLTR
jgi:two-component system, NarL family, sensor histidine kinase DesK